MNLLIFRFSAMGDVALVAPVIEKLTEKYPELSLTIVTRKKFAVFFSGYKNIKIVEADFENAYKGFFGLLRLFSHLLKYHKPSQIIDLHQNLRTGILKFLFLLNGTRSFTINKGRKDKKALTRKHNKIRKPLPHTVQRYLQTFTKAGYPTEYNTAKKSFFKIDNDKKNLNDFLIENNLINEQNTWVGLAPFAQHTQKMWGFENHIDLLKKIFEFNPEIKIFLFGGGIEEIEKLVQLKILFPGTIMAAGKLALVDELLLIKKLGLMICMDSGNMHLAALSGIPVLSIWGATHYFSGFGPYNQFEENILEVPLPDLSCRPCSVFGNKPCFRGDLACLQMISPEMVFERFIVLINKNLQLPNY